MEIKQFVIDRYNEKQDRWYTGLDKKKNLHIIISGLDKDVLSNGQIINEYDFLFNVKRWGFPKAYWGNQKWSCKYCCELISGEPYNGCQGSCEAVLMQCEKIKYVWQYHFQQMAIVGNKEKYLKDYCNG